MDKGSSEAPDPGLRSLNHYRNKLPAWRYWPRQKILPLIRYETPYLAWFQEKIRTPSLDSYFAFTANLGTHTFFTIFLPIFFWCGYSRLGRGVVHVLATGVFASGFIKDLLCLPRPLSPPLQRITMSGSVSLEYGFPSTHSTNAISVAAYTLSLLRSPDNTISPQLNFAFQAFLYIYAISIVVGRLYCGMHGFCDVIFGCLLGEAIALVQCWYGDQYDAYLASATAKEVCLIVLVILVLVRIHPEPADDCPCFDDSVAFAGVFIGVEAFWWHFAHTDYAWSDPIPGTIPYRLADLGWFKTILRLTIGVVAVLSWRAVMKPTLLRVLPPLFRGLGKIGLLLPRRFFTQASEYKKVPGSLKDKDVIPNFSEIPSILTSIRHPRRRAISIGPQSEADAYETLAYREKRRRESISDRNRSPSGERPLPAKIPSKLEAYEQMMGTGASTEDRDLSPAPPGSPLAEPEHSAEGPNDTEMFSRITKPRVRYDVEVVTKLIVYTGIAFIAVEGAPIIFHYAGLEP